MITIQNVLGMKVQERKEKEAKFSANQDHFRNRVEEGGTKSLRYARNRWRRWRRRRLNRKRRRGRTGSAIHISTPVTGPTSLL
jgi:hypothetical protein